MKSGLAAVCIALGVFLPSAALACQCYEDKNAQAHIDRADAIFEGRVIKSVVVGRGTMKIVNGPDYHYDVQGTDFRVLRVWKGKVPRIVQIQHSANLGCDLRFEIGKAYKHFARREEDGTLTSDFCLHPYFTEGFSNRPWSEYQALLGQPLIYE